MGKWLKMRGTPLTIEQIKVLKQDDYVWMVFKEWGKRAGLYGHVVNSHDEELVIDYNLIDDDFVRYLHSDYGKTWLVYKNKEAENAGYGNIEQAVREFATDIIELLDEMGMERSSEYNDGYDDGVADCITNIKSRIKEKFGGE